MIWRRNYRSVVIWCCCIFFFFSCLIFIAHTEIIVLFQFRETQPNRWIIMKVKSATSTSKCKWNSKYLHYCTIYYRCRGMKIFLLICKLFKFIDTDLSATQSNNSDCIQALVQPAFRCVIWIWYFWPQIFKTDSPMRTCNKPYFESTHSDTCTILILSIFEMTLKNVLYRSSPLRCEWQHYYK